MPLSTKMYAFVAVTIAALANLNSSVVTAQDFRAVRIDGNTVSNGQAVSVVYDAGTFHMWYRNDTPAGEIGGLQYATSANGLSFTTQGALSFSSDPFAGSAAPYLYYENASLVGGDYKIQHWTSNGAAGDFPNYNYNISISNAGSTPSLVVDHQGPVGGGTFGQTAGSFGIVSGNLYMQGGAGRQLVRSAYVDGNPPSVSGGLSIVGDFQGLFDSLGISNGYINNHSDVIDLGGSDMAFLFTVRDSSGTRFDQQLYASLSSDGGATWGSAFGVLTAPTLEGATFGGNFAHADVVIADGVPVGYFSAQDALGNYVIATSAVPEPATLALVGLSVLGLGIARPRRK